MCICAEWKKRVGGVNNVREGRGGPEIPVCPDDVSASVLEVIHLNLNFKKKIESKNNPQLTS